MSMNPEDMDVPFYNGITQAETGSFQVPWIRTTYRKAPGGSTAFGPAQLTYTTAKDYVDRKLVSSESAQFFKRIMEPMYQGFQKHGNKKNLTEDQKKFDYGGTGGFDPSQHAPRYEQLAQEIMRAKLKEKNGDVRAAIQSWRGVPRSADPRYYAVAEGAMNE
ncbi:conserved hypothetical protein [Gammaproteobacteria bacterium]